MTDKTKAMADAHDLVENHGGDVLKAAKEIGRKLLATTSVPERSALKKIADVLDKDLKEKDDPEATKIANDLYLTTLDKRRLIKKHNPIEAVQVLVRYAALEPPEEIKQYLLRVATDMIPDMHSYAEQVRRDHFQEAVDLLGEEKGAAHADITFAAKISALTNTINEMKKGNNILAKDSGRAI